MNNNYLYHHGILGQKWGKRRWQNEDGSLTEEGRVRYNKKLEKSLKKEYRTNITFKQALKDYYTKKADADALYNDNLWDILEKDKEIMYYDAKFKARENTFNSKIGQDYNESLKQVDSFIDKISKSVNVLNLNQSDIKSGKDYLHFYLRYNF